MTEEGGSMSNGDGSPVESGLESHPRASEQELRARSIDRERTALTASLGSFNAFKEEKGLDRISLREYVKETDKASIENLTEAEQETWFNTHVESGQRLLASQLFDIRVSPKDELLGKVKDLFTPEDYSEIQKFLFGQLQHNIQLGTLPQTQVDGEFREFAEDKGWLDLWKNYFDEHPELKLA